MAATEQDIHKYAVEAGDNLNHLATGLAQAQAAPEVVDTVKKMAMVMKKVILALGPSAQPAPTPEPSSPPAQPSAAPAPEAQPPMTMDAATNHLHTAMRAAASARQGGR